MSVKINLKHFPKVEGNSLMKCFMKKKKKGRKKDRPEVRV